MTVDDTQSLRKLCVTVSVALKSDYFNFTKMPVSDLIDLCKDLKEVTKRK